MTEIEFPDWDIDLFVYLNSRHVAWLDPVMTTISSFLYWGISFVVIALLVLRKNGYWGKRAVFFALLGLGANSLINNVVKLVIVRDRPALTSSLRGLVHQLDDPGFTTSFFSAHTSNSVCLAIFVALYFRNTYCSIALFAWALLIGYSRIYVGMHFPLDVLTGAIFGLIVGWFTFWIYTNYCHKHPTYLSK